MLYTPALPRLLLAKLPPSSLPGAARLLSMATAIATTLEEQLAHAPWLQLLPVPGAGRGLFAAAKIEQGTVVLEEVPMLCAPSPHALDSTCNHCLQPLANSGSSSSAALPFCSSSCSTAAQGEWAAAAARCDFELLQQTCRESGEKFPLMLARLACLHVQQQRRLLDGSSSSERSSSERSSSGSRKAAGPAAGAEALVRGDLITQLRHLCFANLTEPPQPWAETHQLLLHGLQPLCNGGNSSDSSCSREWLEQKFTLTWYCDALARLHLNSFRVDTVPPLDTSDPAALLKAVAASLASAEAAAHHTGSAAYLLASMLNHSCEPNLDVTFPHNNAVACFIAARDISHHEQLTVSYIDAGQGLVQRQQALSWAYGFRCACPRCVEEAEVAGSGG